MAFFLKGLFWLSLLGGAGAAIGLPTNDAVRSIINKQKIRETGWSGEAEKSYEEYWYGKRGFGDSRTKKVNNNGWSDEIKNALTDIRQQWGKNKLGEGLEKKFEGWLNQKKLCNGTISQVDSSSAGECSVGNIEFIEKKDKSLFGRIPLAGKDGKKSNVYVQWYKCTNDAKNSRRASGIWFGGSRSEGEEQQKKSSIKDRQKYSWCFGAEQSK